MWTWTEANHPSREDGAHMVAACLEARANFQAFRRKRLVDPSQFWASLPPMYSDQLSRVMATDSSAILISNYGIGERQIIAPAIYRMAHDAGYAIPKSAVSAIYPYGRAQDFFYTIDQTEGYNYDLSADCFGSRSRDQPKLLILEEGTVAAEKLGSKFSHLDTNINIFDQKLLAKFYNYCADHNIRLIVLMSGNATTTYENRMCRAEALNARDQNSQPFFEVTKLDAEFVPAEYVDEFFTAMNIERDLIDFFIDPDNEVLRHPRLFDYLLAGMWPQPYISPIIRTCEDLRIRLVNHVGYTTDGPKAYEHMLNHMIGADVDALVTVWAKLGLEFTPERLLISRSAGWNVGDHSPSLSRAPANPLVVTPRSV